MNTWAQIVDSDVLATGCFQLHQIPNGYGAADSGALGNSSFDMDASRQSAVFQNGAGVQIPASLCLMAIRF